MVAPASVVVVVAAIEEEQKRPRVLTTTTTATDMNPTKSQPASGVLLASLVLPGLAALACMAPQTATAESAPEKTTLALKYGHYTDSQPGWERVTARSPQVYVLAPIAGEWSLEASAVMDAVSGATPRWHTQHTAFSGASRMDDVRRAADVKLTRYFARAAVSVSLANSNENDYASHAAGVEARWSSKDNNRTWTTGLGQSNDSIDASKTGGSGLGGTKNTKEYLFGVSQVLTADDVVQFNLTRSVGSGYFSDPYKSFDQRPDQRDAWIALARWNHYLAPLNASLRSSYRYYNDTFGVRSHTLGVDWVQSAGQWTITPGLRYYSQSAANFYLDPILNAQGQYDQIAVITRAVKLLGNNQSTDQRLAAFGAVTASIKLAYAWTADTSVDVKFETYRQTAGLHLGGEGSPGLDPFTANFVQIGLTHKF